MTRWIGNWRSSSWIGGGDQEALAAFGVSLADSLRRGSLLESREREILAVSVP